MIVVTVNNMIVLPSSIIHAIVELIVPLFQSIGIVIQQEKLVTVEIVALVHYAS